MNVSTMDCVSLTESNTKLLNAVLVKTIVWSRASTVLAHPGSGQINMVCMSVSFYMSVI